MILFEGAHDHELVEGFGRAITRELPDIRWSIEPETVAVAADEVGIRLDLMKMQTHSAPWLGESQGEMTSGTIQATVLASDKRASIKADFVDKPWIENFYGFWNSRPNTRRPAHRIARTDPTSASHTRSYSKSNFHRCSRRRFHS
jgi:hypothetical protein